MRTIGLLDSGASGWASCPLTENGLVRVLSHPDYGGATGRPADLVQLMRQFCASGHHVFWPDTVSLRDKRIFNASMIRGHRQVGDIYLLGLAKKHGGRLATFDRSIPLSAVVGAAPDALTVISAA